MKTVKNRIYADLEVNCKTSDNYLSIIGFDGEYVEMDKQGATQLIEILKEFIGESD